MMQFSERFNMAITTAQAGDRKKALEIFHEIVDQAPANVQAWLWISELAMDLEEQTYALDQATRYAAETKDGPRDLQIELAELRRNMGRLAPSTQLNTLFPKQKQDVSRNDLLVDEKCQLAERLILMGKNEEALQVLHELEENHLANERVWLLMSELQSELPEKNHLLEKVLETNPNHEEAIQRIEVLQPLLESPMQAGQHLEENGEFEQAIDLYRAVTTHSKSAMERIEANRRIANIRMLQEANRAMSVHPNLSLMRLAAGPVLLYLLLMFIQGGLSLLHLPVLAVPGFLCVTVGSLILSATDMRPVHPKWVARFGAPGSVRELKVRRDARILGWGLMILPFVWFLADAGNRMGILQSSMSGVP